jgi:hypothetical protein
MNKWNIPAWLEADVKDRDTDCVYCRIQFASSGGPKRSIATWEHIVNDARLITRENIARCCFACNSSKGTKKLLEWLKTAYCRSRGITPSTVAEVIRRALELPTCGPMSNREQG